MQNNDPRAPQAAVQGAAATAIARARALVDALRSNTALAAQVEARAADLLGERTLGDLLEGDRQRLQDPGFLQRTEAVRGIDTGRNTSELFAYRLRERIMPDLGEFQRVAANLADPQAIRAGRLIEDTWARGAPSLVLRDQRLQRLPDLSGMVNLRALDLRGNLLQELPQGTDQLPLLAELIVSDNQLERLPDAPGELGGLRRLLADDNELTTLPGWLGSLDNQAELDFGSNLITALPPSFAEWQFGSLTLADNPLLDSADITASIYASPLSERVTLGLDEVPVSRGSSSSELSSDESMSGGGRGCCRVT